MASNNVASLDHFRMQYKQEAEQYSESQVFSGFSDRLNLIIDKTEGLNVPSMDDRGRMAYIHKITGHSKPAVSDWLQKDILPRDQTLRGLVAFLLRHIPGEFNVLRVESWLRFGEEATPCPFTTARPSEDSMAMRPLAAQLIAAAGKELDISVSSYDLQSTMEDVVSMLMDYGVNGKEDIQGPMHDLAKYYIQQHLR